MADIKTLNMEIKKGDLIIGVNTISKALKKKQVAKIYVSNDILPNLLASLENDVKSQDIKIFTLELNKEQLKELCKKPFFISAFAIKKGNEEKEIKEESEEKEEKQKTKTFKENIKEEITAKTTEKKEDKEKKKNKSEKTKEQKIKISSEEDKKSKKSK